MNMRLFRLNRIGWYRILDELVPDRKYPLKKEERSDEKKSLRPEDMAVLQLHFSSKAASQVRDYFPPDEIESQPDGTFLVHTAFPPGRWVTGFLLSFGSQVQVLEPKAWQEILLEEAKQIQKLYARAMMEQWFPTLKRWAV